MIFAWVSAIPSFLICFVTFVVCNVYISYIHLIRLCLLSQSSVLHSQPKSTVGTPAYIAPEVLLKKEYDGKVKKLGLKSSIFLCVPNKYTLLCILVIVFKQYEAININ